MGGTSSMNDKSLDLLFYNHFISLDPNMYYISLTPCTKYRAMTSNNVIKFMHSNWITQSYYSSPKLSSLIPGYFIHFSHLGTL